MLRQSRPYNTGLSGHAGLWTSMHWGEKRSKRWVENCHSKEELGWSGVLLFSSDSGLSVWTDSLV
jgi:hypothetical protein